MTAYSVQLPRSKRHSSHLPAGQKQVQSYAYLSGRYPAPAPRLPIEGFSDRFYRREALVLFRAKRIDSLWKGADVHG